MSCNRVALCTAALGNGRLKVRRDKIVPQTFGVKTNDGYVTRDLPATIFDQKHTFLLLFDLKRGNNFNLP